MAKTLRNRRINKRSLKKINTKKNKNYRKKTQKGYGKSLCDNAEKKTEIESLRGLVRLEFKDEKSNKFWQIEKKGTDTISQNGKIGSDRPRQTTKSHESEDIARHFMVSEICSKLDKGYVIVKEKSSARVPLEKLSEESQLEKLEKEKQELEDKIKKTREAIKEEKEDKEKEKIEALKKEVQSLDTEIDKLKGNIEELNKQLIPLLERKKTAELKIKDIVNFQQRKQEREAEEKKEKQLKERLTVLKQNKGLITGDAHSINISEEIERWEEKDDKNNKDDLFEMKTVDKILDTIGASELKTKIKFGDLVNFDSYRHYSCKIVNDLRELVTPTDVEELTVGVDITKFLEDPINFYDVNDMTGDDDGCPVSYVDFTLENVKGDKKTKTKEIFEKFNVDKDNVNENTVFSYGYYEDSLYVDGEEVEKI